MSSAVDYKGLQLVTSDALATARSVLNPDLMELADRAGPVHLAEADPAAANDCQDTAGLGKPFYTFSKWLNTVTGELFFCTDQTAAAAVWRSIGAQLDWQAAVIDQISGPPGSPSDGDRYLVIAAEGDWAEYNNQIAQYADVDGWHFTLPDEGMAVCNAATQRMLVYNGTAWVLLGSVVDHGALAGLTDDDHPQYVLTDGTRGFTAPIAGVAPVAAEHLTTKAYVDGLQPWDNRARFDAATSTFIVDTSAHSSFTLGPWSPADPDSVPRLVVKSTSPVSWHNAVMVSMEGGTHASLYLSASENTSQQVVALQNYANQFRFQTHPQTFSGNVFSIDLDATTNDLIKIMGDNSVVICGLKMPTSDGTAGQVLTTNGAGQLAFADAGGDAATWTENAGALAPVTNTDRVLLGGTTDDGASALQVAGTAVCAVSAVGGTATHATHAATTYGITSLAMGLCPANAPPNAWGETVLAVATNDAEHPLSLLVQLCGLSDDPYVSNGRVNLQSTILGDAPTLLTLNGEGGNVLVGSMFDDGSDALLQVNGDVNLPAGHHYRINGTPLDVGMKLRAETTLNTADPAPLSLDGSGLLPAVPTDTVWSFQILLAGATAGCGDVYSFEIRGTAVNAGGTLAVKLASLTTLSAAKGTILPAVAADGTSLVLSVSDGAAGGDTICWVAVLRTAEISFPAP